MDVELLSAPAAAVPPKSANQTAWRSNYARPMSRDDIPAVARLFCKAFRGGKLDVAPDLAPYLETVFFGSPHYRPENGGVVYDSGSGVTSAILAVPMEFTALGRPIIARLLCAFMADGKDGAVGAAHLARQMRAAKQDMCFSDNSSPVSANHWIAGGGVILPIQSLEWRRSFRPLTAAAIAGSRAAPLLRSRAILSSLSYADRALRRRGSSIEPAAPRGCRTISATPHEFLRCAGSMKEHFSIRPAWSKREFDWLVAVASMNRRLGQIHCRIVVDAHGAALGAFLFFGKKGQEATVLNILCNPGCENAVSDEMFAHLDAEGYASASGISQPFIMNAIARQRWLTFKHRGYFCMVTRHAEIKDAALRNDIYIGGLASESWSRLLTDF